MIYGNPGNQLARIAIREIDFAIAIYFEAGIFIYAVAAELDRFTIAQYETNVLNSHSSDVSHI